MSPLNTSNTESPVLDDNNGERMVPEVSGGLTFWEHVYRYAFASDFVKGKHVLDIACGEGYGSAVLLRAGAQNVVGIDISESACLHARQKYGIDARVGSAENIPLPNNSVEIIVSFETVEHVPNPGRFLDECARVLVAGGILVISTPNKEVYTDNLGERNPHHHSEMTEQEFISALHQRFRHIRVYTQRPISTAWWSPRTILCENTPWTHIRGFRRLRRALQRRFFSEAINDPTDEQRTSALTIILAAARSRRRLLNQYLVRPQRKLYQEKSVYIIAVAVR
jgi:2-polyprenyl-3-methyl-5-hydroxy-6-metoxy-1,4-benzoquinol methylase